MGYSKILTIFCLIFLQIGCNLFQKEEAPILEMDFVKIEVNEYNSKTLLEEHMAENPRVYQKGSQEWMKGGRFYPISSFFLGRYEVTNEQYATFLNEYASDVLKGTVGNHPLLLTPNPGLEKNRGKWKIKSG